MRNKSIPSQTNNLNTTADKASVAPDNTTSSNHIEALEKQRDLILTHREALAGSPEDIAVCGEEDIGSGLEFLVTRNHHSK